MYIKQVIIQGFKSYHDQTIVESFDSGHNVIVGRNGAGKSNFFAAIEFVLSDEFSHMRPEQRQALLHEGPGLRVMTAHVELILDNADGRIPIEKNEVHLRRVIGAKKDIYLLNKMSISRSEVMNLLESAGFSKSNPYYIVKQGAIMKMATATDAQRLRLLREVSGTSTYDKAYEESMNILRDAKQSYESVVERLASIGERLHSLEEEKEELREYERWDKQKRCLDYTIYNRELKDTAKKLEQLATHRDICNREQSQLCMVKENTVKEYNAAVERLKEAKNEVKRTKKDLETIRTEVEELVSEKTRLTLTIKDLDAEVDGEEEMRIRYQQELEELEPTILEKEAELNDIKSKYEKLEKENNECTVKLAVAEQKRKELLAKQGRGRQFSSKEERDAWIKDELEKLESQIEAKEKYFEEMRKDLEEDREKEKDLGKKIAEQSIEMEKEKLCIAERNAEFEKLNKQKEQCQAAKKEMYREEHNLGNELSARKEELAKVEQTLKSMVGKLILDGAESVRKVLESFRARGEMAEGYYGQVIDRFECEPVAETAVGITGGNRLLNHIVQTDKLGTKILKEMNNQRLPGEVTFMPLNRLCNKVPRSPENDNCRPMLSFLRYDPKYQPALSYIFGKTLICRSIDIATSYAQQYDRDCITVDGDQASSKGSLTGGYISKQNSRIRIYRNRSELMSEIARLQNELITVKEAITKANEDINSYISKMQKIETMKGKGRIIYEKMKGEIDIMKEELEAIQSYREKKERSCSECASNLEAMRVTKLELQKEFDEELVLQLPPADREQIDALNDEIRDLRIMSKSAFSKIKECEVVKNRLENQLTNVLKRRRDELLQCIQKISVEDRQRKLNSCNSELVEIEKKLVAVNDEFESLNEKRATALKKQNIEMANVEKCMIKEKEAQEIIEAKIKDIVKITSKHNILEAKLTECTNRVSALGALPNPEVCLKFNSMSTKQLFKEIEKTNNNLKNYSHVNKKALEQFVTFSEKKEKLANRQEELERAEEKITELMTVLEERKHEHIHFTFKQISKYFSEIFKKLVPSGHGELVVKTANQDVNLDAADIERYTGVGIRVSFTSENVQMQEIAQLSGGQKSVVAIAMIFAIQKCDAAPFYLFDEVDAALDAEHRQAVAEMIHELSSSAQFITTTFKPELLRYANKVYGVTYQGRVSRIMCVTQEEAADFLKDDNLTES